MDVSFWSRNPLAVATSTEQPAPESGWEERATSSVMSVIRSLEHVLDTLVSAAMTPLANLKSTVSSIDGHPVTWYATALVALIGAAILIVIFISRSSFKTLVENYKESQHGYDSEDDEEDEDDDEDSYDYRGRGDRPSRKSTGSRRESHAPRTRQRRRR